MPRTAIVAAPIVEPTTSMAEAFENSSDKFRREYAQIGADWAYFIVRFLQGRRVTEIQQEEILKTQLFLRANDAERHALLFVCKSDFPRTPTPEDELKLRVRDSFLIDYVDGICLGHADQVAEIQSIPNLVVARENADRKLFAQVWESPKIFQWIFEGR